MDNSTGSSFLKRHQFLLYRLFSLSGIVPIGGYVIIHLLTNATVLDSPATFQKNVDTIHSLGIILPAVEWVFIFLPMLFHAAIGWAVIRGSIVNVSSYQYTSNIRYTLQRATGMIAFFFIIYHVWHLHWMAKQIGGGQFDAHHAASSTASALAPLWVQIVYAIGVLSAVYHLANGIWTFGLTWGIWTSERAMRGASYVCLLFGLGLATVGLSALVGMRNVDVGSAKETEARIFQENQRLRGLPVDSRGGENDRLPNANSELVNSAKNSE